MATTPARSFPTLRPGSTISSSYPSTPSGTTTESVKYEVHIKTEGKSEEAAAAGAPKAPREIVIPGEEEERRLFYVSVTRAKQELYLVFPVMARDRGGLDVLMEPSRFVRELPGEVYEKWVIESKASE